MKNTSNICEKLFSKDDAMDILLKKYDELKVDYQMLSDSYDNSKDVLRISGYVKELFLQNYFAVKIESMDKVEKQKLKQIIGEKYEMKKGICDDYATGLLIFDQIQSKYGNVSRELIPDNIYNDLTNDKYEKSNLSDFNSSGTTGTLGNGATYTIGTYTLYGKTVGCYKYYSGDYTTTEQSNINTSFDSTHTSWSRIYTCTKKYNCHSFAWINSSSSNVYWLNNPDFYSGSSSFTYTGTNGSASTGNKIIIQGSMASDDGFGNSTYAIHSLNASSSGSNSTSIKTTSKLGNIGVYSAPLIDMMGFYSGFAYKVYK